MGHDLVVEVEEIKGTCPVYQPGDRMVFREGYRLDLERTDAVCSHAMGVFLPWLAALSKGVQPQQLGLAREGDTCAHVQCPDPGGEHTGAASNYPICSPCRAMLLTGQYSLRNGVISNCLSRTAPYGVELKTNAP